MELKSAISSVFLHAGKHLKASPNQRPYPLPFLLTGNTKHFSVKEAVFPFLKFPGIDTLLGPEMLSTGEVMGISDDFGIAFAKSQIAAGNTLPTSGKVLFSVKDSDKKKAVELARKMNAMGFRIIATKGTCIKFINSNIPSEFVLKMTEGRPNIVDWIINGKIDLIINTTIGAQSIKDSFPIRRTALDKQVPYVTTIRGDEAVVKANCNERKKNHCKTGSEIL